MFIASFPPVTSNCAAATPSSPLRKGRSPFSPHSMGRLRAPSFPGAVTFSRDRQNVTAPGKDGARNLPIEWGEKGERPFLKGEDGVAAAQLDVTGGEEWIRRE